MILWWCTHGWTKRDCYPMEGLFYNISIVCAQAPNELSNDYVKDVFYEYVKRTSSNTLTWNLNALVGSEQRFLDVSSITNLLLLPDEVTKKRNCSCFNVDKHGKHITESVFLILFTKSRHASYVKDAASCQMDPLPISKIPSYELTWPKNFE